ncbi:ARM repeat-containing protein [Dendrothele bispora CBS 962.96]|uniref:ARM repeat-containing protein n=1 Tax=Dendrothele bispora (strain CBS 962.96) TaxID=1314807 RepID=A0A4S8LSZ8_DENBC|nr:ARM repeat-containing protein [Dendrothele bispora CBS 962.96]
MDLQTLSNLFATTFSPDPNVRKAGELQIRKIGNEEGMINALLQIIAADTIDVATRQACAVWVKNRVHTNYTIEASSSAGEPRRPDRQPVAPSDRSALRSSVLRLIATAPSRAITLQLANTFKIIVGHDYPEKWSGLVNDIKALLTSGDIREVHAGCVASLELVRAFRFRQKPDIMQKIVGEVFPSLVTIATNMLQTASSQPQNQEIPMMLHLILKTYKTSIIINLSPQQQAPDSLVPWGQLLFAVVNLQVPKEAVPEDEEDKERSEWWKAKKWAYAILGRLFHRFGNPSQLPSPMQKEYGDFAQHFVTVFAPEILNMYLRQVELYVSGQSWLSKKCQYHIFTFFTECVKPKSTWTLLKPHFETLVSSFAFPHLMFTPSKKNLWENDPVDYVRVSVDEYESFATPVSAATTFLFSLAGNRTKTTFMPILGFVNNILRNPTSPPHQRFGALNMTAALGPWIMKHPSVKGDMEEFCMRFVYPELVGREGWMKAIACEVIGTLTKSGMEWKNGENLNKTFHGVARALDDPEFPVRVQAALALTEMILIHETVRNQVAPQVGKVVQDLLKLSDDTDLDILNRSMEVMVEQFQSELLPVAAQLIQRLCESYLRLAKESTAENIIDSSTAASSSTEDLEAMMADTDDDKTYAAMGVAKTIWTVVSSVDNSPEILAQVQEIIIPIVLFTLESKLLDLFDNMYELVDTLTFKLRAISPNMWPVFEATYKLFKSDAVDFLDEMLPSLDNFISYGTDVFRARSDYRQMVVDIYTTSINNAQLGENDKINGCKLAESLLLNLRGSIVDQALQLMIFTALSYLDKAETTPLKLALLEVLVNSVLYNPSASLHIIESSQSGAARAFFDRWFAAINNSERRLPRVHDKKLSVLALCALLEMDPAQIPESLREGWPGIVGGVLRLFKDLPKAVAERKALEDALAEEDEDDELEDEKLLNLTGDDEDVWDEDSAYLEMLAKEGARLREKSEKLEAGEDIDSDSDDEEIEEELGYISPLDNVNPYSSFKQALTAFQMRNGPGYQAATTALDVEQQTLLMEVMRLADQPAEGTPAS